MFYWGPDLDDGVVSWNESSAVRFGAVLRVLREARGLTQESLAFQAGVTKNQVRFPYLSSSYSKSNFDFSSTALSSTKYSPGPTGRRTAGAD